jgi:hypothetical protein
MQTPIIFDARNVVAPIKGACVVNYGNLFKSSGASNAHVDI